MSWEYCIVTYSTKHFRPVINLLGRWPLTDHNTQKVHKSPQDLRPPSPQASAGPFRCAHVPLTSLTSHRLSDTVPDSRNGPCQPAVHSSRKTGFNMSPEIPARRHGAVSRDRQTMQLIFAGKPDAPPRSAEEVNTRRDPALHPNRPASSRPCRPACPCFASPPEAHNQTTTVL